MKSSYIGIDLGGTKVLLQGFNKKLEVCFEIKEKTESNKEQKGILNQLTKLIDQAFDSKIKGIGIAVPGIVNQKNGDVVHTPHLPFNKDFPLKQYLEKRYKVPLKVDNDINAFLMAEKERKELKKCQNILAVMVGTGVGGAFFCNGNLLYGTDGFAGEVGHMVVCEDGKLDTFEKKTSGFYIPDIARSLGIKKKMDSYELDKDTADTRKVKQALLKNLALGLSNLNLIFNPEYIVLGGSIYELFLSSKKKELKQIIAKHALNGKSPKLLDAKKRTSVAEGMVRILLEKVSILLK